VGTPQKGAATADHIHGTRPLFAQVMSKISLGF
jgi:hypothetical protein